MPDSGKLFGASRRVWPDWSPLSEEERRRIIRGHVRNVKAVTVSGLQRHLARVRRWAEEQAQLAVIDDDRREFLGYLEDVGIAEGALSRIGVTLEEFSDGHPVRADSLGGDLTVLSRLLERLGVCPGRTETAVEVDARRLEAGVGEVIKYLREDSGKRHLAGVEASTD